jgi:cytochrome c oxidase subunit I+III
VGTANGRPQEVFRVAHPSIWPLIAASGLLVVFAAELLKLRWGIAAGVAVMVVAVIGWNWPEEPPMTVEEEDAFEREHQVAVNAGGSVVIAAWGMGLMILFVSIAFASLLLGYFYLRLENPEWPPPGIADPGFTRVLVAAGLVLGSGTVARAGLRRLVAGDQRGFVTGLTGGLALGALALAVQIVDLVRLDFGWAAHAYGSIFFTLAGFVVLVGVAAIAMTLMILYWARRGLYTARRHAAVGNVANFWTAAQVIWFVGFGTLYLGPHLT